MEPGRQPQGSLGPKKKNIRLRDQPLGKAPSLLLRTKLQRPHLAASVL